MAINSQLPMAGVLRLQEIYDRSLARTSFALVMLVIAGAMALLLGLTGIYGVISYSVSQRTREIGIRVALGAQAGSVRRMFVAHGLVLGGDGVAIGIAVAAGLMRLMSTMLFDVSPADPLTHGLVSLALIAAATLASYIPAARAMAVDRCTSSGRSSRFALTPHTLTSSTTTYAGRHPNGDQPTRLTTRGRRIGVISPPLVRRGW